MASGPRPWATALAQPFAVFAAYVLSARLGMLLQFPGTDSPVGWPPAGIALGAAMLMGRRSWPAIALGAFATNLLVHPRPDLATSVVLGVAVTTALGNTLAAAAGASLVRRSTRRRDPLARPADVVRFLLFGAVLSTAIGTTIGQWALIGSRVVPAFVPGAWVAWWLGDALGVLLMLPFMLTWKFRARSWTTGRALELLALLALMGAFVWSSAYLGATGRFFFIPLLIWTGTRFGRFENAVVALLFATGYTLAILFGAGAAGGPASYPEFLNHEGYVAIVVSSLLVLTSLVHQLNLFQDATLASEKRFRNLFEMHHSVMLVSDPARGVVVDANPAAAAFYGYPREKLRGMEISEINALPREELERMLGRIASGELSDLVTTHRLASGEERRVELRTSRVEGGERPTYLAIITDVTERERLDRIHDLLGAIVGSSDDAIFSKDLESNVLSWNSGAENMYGYTAAEMVGRPITVIIPADRLDEHARIMEDVRTGHGVHRLETDRLHRDGRLINVSLTLSPLRNAAGVVFGASTVARDVTERKALAERLLHSQKLESVGRLAGGVAHDFNNILTAIIGYTELAKLDMCTECPIRPSVAPIENATGQARRLTSSLLAFSRRQVMSVAPARVNDLVTASAEMLGRLIGEHIELVLDLESANPTVLVDAGQMDQVLMNLATNARDAMPAGGVLTIGTRLCDRDDAESPDGADGGARRVRITLSDTGTGIDAALRDRVFEPFFTTKSRGKGTGLGLAIAYGVVEQHGGALRLEAAGTAGTTFSITLPVVGSCEDSEAIVKPNPLPRGEECILLAEDNPDVRGLNRRILERHGYRVLEAPDGQKAIDILAAHAAEIDLVLSDVVMPRRSGRDVFEAAGQLRPGLPVILTSGYVDEVVPTEWIRRDGRDFLPKPSTPSQLLSQVREVLDRPRGPAGGAPGPGLDAP